MIGEIGSVKYYHSIIGKESFEKMNMTKKGIYHEMFGIEFWKIKHKQIQFW